MAVPAQEDGGIPPIPLVGGYRLERIVSEEPAFHVLYDGVHADTGEAVSVKVFAVESDRGLARRFVLAARRRAAVRHPHLLGIHGASEWEGRLVLATERCELPTLADRLQAGPLGRRQSIEILGEVADALDAAAAAGIIDHELSPSSIMLDVSRGVLLGDLGIVTSLTEGLPPWAQPYPHHMSPEAARGEPVESASNVYSLASVLLECLTGAPPFEGNLQLIAYSHAAEEPPRPSDRNPDLGEGFDAVMQVALAKAPRDRFASARELIDAAAGALGVAPATAVDLLPARPQPAPVAEPPVVLERVPRPRLPSFELPRRLRLALVALPLAAAIATAGYLAGDSGEAPRAVATPAPPEGPSPQLVAAARGIDGTVARLNRALREGRARLASARTPRGQARAADALARIYRVAASEVSGIAAVGGLHPLALALPMVVASRGYSQLARAARVGNRRAFTAARRDVAATESALRRELAGL